MSSSLDMHDLPRYRGAARKLPSANAHFSTELREVREELNVVGDALLLGCEAAGATTKRGVSGRRGADRSMASKPITTHYTIPGSKDQARSMPYSTLSSHGRR
eukprot:scpid58533/ scgid0912/ 